MKVNPAQALWLVIFLFVIYAHSQKAPWKVSGAHTNLLRAPGDPVRSKIVRLPIWEDVSPIFYFSTDEKESIHLGTIKAEFDTDTFKWELILICAGGIAGFLACGAVPTLKLGPKSAQP